MKIRTKSHGQFRFFPARGRGTNPYCSQSIHRLFIRHRQATAEPGYFRNNLNKMDYAGYHASGLILSGGPVPKP